MGIKYYMCEFFNPQIWFILKSVYEKLNFHDVKKLHNKGITVVFTEGTVL